MCSACPRRAKITLEVGVFAAATALAGRLAPASLAAHQIALNIAAFAFMVPLGVSSAGAVRVGHAVGRLDPAGAARAGWTALLLGVGFMAIAALSFVMVPRLLIGAFTKDAGVLRGRRVALRVGSGVSTVRWSAGVATGVSARPWRHADRHAVEPGGPLVHRAAARVYALLRPRARGVVGLWWGLSAGLIICGIALLTTWYRKSRDTHRIQPSF